MTPNALAGARKDSEALDHGVQAGLVAYGVVHLIVAWTAAELVFGDSSGKASQSGALAQLSQSTPGRISLYVVALGFLALVIWQGLEAAVGHRSADGGKRAAKRVGSAVKVGVYATLGYSAIKLATGSGKSSSGTDTMTARLMSAPGGQVLVGLVGLVVIGVGIYLGGKGVTRKFTNRLDSAATTGTRGTVVLWLGILGYLAKGATLAAVGTLFLVAAVRHEPDESGGLDQALHELLKQPFGSPLLFAVAIGLACYGFFCFFWARHLDR